MLSTLSAAVALGVIVLVIWAMIFVLSDRAVILRQLIVAGVVELIALIQAIILIIEVSGGHGVDQPALLWGYVITSLVVLPIAAAWSFAERTRWSSVVLAVAAIAQLIVQWRIVEVWN